MLAAARAMNPIGSILGMALGLFLCLASPLVQALDATTLTQLSLGEGAEKIAAIDRLVEQADASAIPVLQALSDGTLHVAADQQAVIVAGNITLDALTLKEIPALPAEPEKVSINNRIRLKLASALAALKLVSPDKAVRLQAVQTLESNADQELLPLIGRVLEKESDAEIRRRLQWLHATLSLNHAEAPVRRAAVQALAQSATGNTKSLLLARLEKDAQGNWIEADEDVRAEVTKAIQSMEAELSIYEYAGRAFSGLSLGSILLLAALGLAITFGLMGIINMAHGELLMIGAYATYVVQTLFRTYWPGLFDWYLAAAVPAAFVVAALVGVLLERSVIRFLYGRPLETLLATWGISLILMQTVRVLFGAQNVEVANPSWMSGGISLASGLVLPYNRIVIIFFAFMVVFLMWLMLTRTRLGLFVRAVTQNRGMADCLGVRTPRVDMLAFGLGSGIAGLGGCALSQIGNVGPDLGQSYIVDSFMVVVLGGVGQLAGTVIAALGLGEANKFLESYAGAVLAKIFVLVFIIVFIQKRPQGLFAAKGRTAEN